MQRAQSRAVCGTKLLLGARHVCALVLQHRGRARIARPPACKRVPAQVEDPLPKSIGLDAPFMGAGMGGVLLGIIFAPARQATRERAMRWGAVVGFVLGGGLYAFALVVQIGWRR